MHDNEPILSNIGLTTLPVMNPSGWRPFAGTPLPVRKNRDFERGYWCFLLWGAPAILAFGASQAYGQSILSNLQAGSLWTLSVAWIGIGCFINGRSCGRVHCRIDGVLFPALSLVGALGVLSVISINWNYFWISFFGILIGSFVVERIFGKYYRKGWSLRNVSKVR